jgi:hypothetical protein
MLRQGSSISHRKFFHHKILRSRIPTGCENTTTAILTNKAKQFRLAKLRLSKSSRISSRYAAVSSLPYAPHAEVVECALSATPNPLESLVGQNEKSPFSNICAVTSKLCSGSRRIALATSPAAKARSSPRHGRVPNSRDFVPWRFSDAGRRTVWLARPCRRPKTCTGADSTSRDKGPRGGGGALVGWCR